MSEGWAPKWKGQAFGLSRKSITYVSLYRSVHGMKWNLCPNPNKRTEHTVYTDNTRWYILPSRSSSSRRPPLIPEKRKRAQLQWWKQSKPSQHAGKQKADRQAVVCDALRKRKHMPVWQRKNTSVSCTDQLPCCRVQTPCISNGDEDKMDMRSVVKVN